MLSAIIIDKDKTSREAIKNCLAEFKHVTLLKSFSALRDAEPYFNLADVIFLTLPASIPQNFSKRKLFYNSPRLIILTAAKKYVEEVLDLDDPNIIQLPVSTTRIAKALTKVLAIPKISGKEIKESPGTLFIRNNKAFIKLNLKDVFLIEGMDDYITIHTNEKAYTVNYTLKKMEAHLPESQFSRIHKSYIVQHSYVQGINTDFLILRNRELPIGPSYRERLRDKLKLPN